MTEEDKEGLIYNIFVDVSNAHDITVIKGWPRRG